MSAKLTNLSFDEPDGKVGDKYFYFFAGVDGARNEGVALALLYGKPGQLLVTLQQRDIRSEGKRLNLASLINVDQPTLQKNFFGFELIIAPSALLQELRQPCNLVDENSDPVVDAAEIDGAPPDGLRVVARFGTASRCVPLRDELAVENWLSDITLVTGATVAGYGNGGGLFDDVAATWLW